MNLESILAMLGSGAGVFLLKVYADWRQAKRGDTKDAVGAWQQIADRESQRFHTLETQITTQERRIHQAAGARYFTSRSQLASSIIPSQIGNPYWELELG